MVEAYGIFQGGGPKGIALVGALARVQKAVKFKAFAGTSAGAIIAALAAAGYPANDEDERIRRGGDQGRPPADIKEIFTGLNLENFLDSKGELGFEHLRRLDGIYRPQLASIMRDLERAMGAKGPHRWWRLWRLTRNYPRQMAAIPEVSAFYKQIQEHKGVYRTTSFTKWMDRLLTQRRAVVDGNTGKVTFASVRRGGLPLKVVATDIQQRSPRVYGDALYAGTSVSEAVRQSMSIPFFFCPCPENENYLVDGGVISNFPAWVFDEELKEELQRTGRQPLVIGFRLVSELLEDSDDSDASEPPFGALGKYVVGLYRTVTEGTDSLQTRGVEDLLTIKVRTPRNITATSFDLSEEQKLELYNTGWRTADEFLKDPANAVKLADAQVPRSPRPTSIGTTHNGTSETYA